MATIGVVVHRDLREKIFAGEKGRGMKSDASDKSDSSDPVARSEQPAANRR